MDTENEKTEILPPEKANLPVPKPQLESGSAVAPIIPRTLDEVARVANAVIAGKMVPASYDDANPEATRAKLMIGIMKGLEVGFGPITALSTICVINNRPCVWGDGAVALAQRAGLVEKVEQMFQGTDREDVADTVFDQQGGLPPAISDDYTAVYMIWRKGQENPYTGRFSVRDAKRAKLWGNSKKQPWMLYPTRMLMNRARAFALRDGFADCLMGLSIAEEIQDIPEAPKAADVGFLEDAEPGEAA